jgi:hypothetical protein
MNSKCSHDTIIYRVKVETVRERKGRVCLYVRECEGVLKEEKRGRWCNSVIKSGQVQLISPF